MWEVNALLQTLQDSHAAVSAWDWMWAVEREHGSVPIRWALEGDALWVAASQWTACPQGLEFSRSTAWMPPNAAVARDWATWKVAALWARPERGSTA